MRDFVEQHVEPELGKGVFGLGALGDAHQDAAAALGFGFEEADVFAKIGVIAQLVGQAVRHERDGAQRPAQFVRGRSGKAAQCRHARFARQRRFRCHQRPRPVAGFGRDHPEIDGEKADRESQRRCHSELIDRRKSRWRADPGQRQRPELQYQHHRARHRAEQGHRSSRQQRRGNGHRYDEQDGEGVGEAAGHEQQCAALQQIEGEMHGKVAALQPGIAAV